MNKNCIIYQITIIFKNIKVIKIFYAYILNYISDINNYILF